MKLNFALSVFQSINYLIEYLFKSQLNEKKLYKDYLKDEEIIVFDIGSNVGNYIKLVTKTLKKKVIEIHSFEPIKILIDNQTAKNATLIKNNILVSDKFGEELFFERKISSQSSTFKKENNSLNQVLKTYNVQTVALDDYIAKYGVEKIDILKIDTEGNELKIIKSLENTLKEKIVRMIKIESTFERPNDFIQIMQILLDNNYLFLGTTNDKYVSNKILFWDSYFLLQE